jgi:hypothetical protein
MTSTRTAAGTRISAHAVARWAERVDPAAGPNEARLALAQLVSMGRARSTPRHWTDARPAPGVTFIYWSQRPSVCAVVADGTVVTVLTRALCASTAPRSAAFLRAVGAEPVRRGRLVPAQKAWRWDGRRDAA